MRVRTAMMVVDPDNLARRRIDGQQNFNRVPSNSQYFSHKLNIYLSEKLIHFGCLVVGAIDGNIF
jgi:hypothetical protein